jgi:hypothetical protein
MKRVTQRKLLRASTALLALSDCEDWDDMSFLDDERLDDRWSAQLPNRTQLAIFANRLAYMAVPDEC